MFLSQTFTNCENRCSHLVSSIQLNIICIFDDDNEFLMLLYLENARSFFLLCCNQYLIWYRTISSGYFKIGTTREMPYSLSTKIERKTFFWIIKMNFGTLCWSSTQTMCCSVFYEGDIANSHVQCSNQVRIWI